MIIKRAEISDMEEILQIQKLAYKSEAEIYNDFSIPPLVQTLAEIEDEFKNQVFLKAVTNQRFVMPRKMHSNFSKAVQNKKIIGSVRAVEIDSKTCYIGRLIVHPDFQNQGIGTRLMNEIENIFNDCERFELFTGYTSKKNLRLYGKLGYKKFKTAKLTENIKLVYLEKINL